jgi:hypothetical protein
LRERWREAWEPWLRPKKKTKLMAKDAVRALFMLSSTLGPLVSLVFLAVAKLPKGHSLR